jgi:hypothetical protein
MDEDRRALGHAHFAGLPVDEWQVGDNGVVIRPRSLGLVHTRRGDGALYQDGVDGDLRRLEPGRPSTDVAVTVLTALRSLAVVTRSRKEVHQGVVLKVACDDHWPSCAVYEIREIVELEVPPSGEGDDGCTPTTVSVRSPSARSAAR